MNLPRHTCAKCLVNVVNKLHHRDTRNKELLHKTVSGQRSHRYKVVHGLWNCLNDELTATFVKKKLKNNKINQYYNM